MLADCAVHMGLTPHARHRFHEGFTFIDLVVSTMVMGILAATALPRFSEVLQRQRATAAAQRICADLRFARNSAIASSATKQINFTVAQSRYTLVGVTSLDRPGTDYAVELSGGTFHSTLVSASLGGDASLRFDLHGQPDSGGTIVVQAGGIQKTITVNAVTGEATTP